MSIFPKRTVPGKGVTIHWNYNTAHLKGVHIFPFVRIGVKAPNGKVVMFYEGNILALPDPKDELNESDDKKPAYKYLNKNTPLIILADYLSSPFKKEILVDILSALQSGRHFYFQYQVPDDAPLGKYELISEVHSNGEVRYSKTVSDDYFFVEKIQLTEIKRQSKHFIANIQNLSPDPVPVKVMECIESENGLSTKVQVFEIPGGKEISIIYSSEKTFLLYNEEREVIPLMEGSGYFSLRNQKLLSLSKKEESEDVIYVIQKDKEDAYKLQGVSKEIWEQADGLTVKEKLEKDNIYKAAYHELLKSGLVEEVQFNK